MEKEKVATVAELIAALQKYPPDAPVRATWEGIVTDIRVFRPEGWDVPPGTVLLDVDN